jgi:site-specific recombinase XerD
LPAEPASVAAYLANIADSGLSASTISRRLAAIGYAHKLKGFEPPGNAETVRAVVRGIRRRIGTAVTQKAPATASALAAMLAAVPNTLAGARDRALLLIGFAGALRRSELVHLTRSDVTIGEEGAIVHLARSKTDQEGAGVDIAIPRGLELKPVEALEVWLAGLHCKGINEGPIFRSIDKAGHIGDRALSAHSVAEIVKRHAAAAGLDPKIFSGHSLRAGFVTSALEHGADLFKVMDVTRHRRVDTLKGYDRRARAFRNHAGKDFL